MYEQRKYAILLAASILAARKLNDIGSKPCPARECAIADAISNAELILRRVDAGMQRAAQSPEHLRGLSG